jgi:hypothetical protein
MMKAIAEMTRKENIDPVVSLNPYHDRRHRHVRGLPRDDWRHHDRQRHRDARDGRGTPRRRAAKSIHEYLTTSEW